jgi:hypothetical protein
MVRTHLTNCPQESVAERFMAFDSRDICTLNGVSEYSNGLCPRGFEPRHSHPFSFLLLRSFWVSFLLYIKNIFDEKAVDDKKARRRALTLHAATTRTLLLGRPKTHRGCLCLPAPRLDAHTRHQHHGVRQPSTANQR